MRARWIAAGIVVVALVGVGVGVFLTVRDDSRPVAIDEAKARAASSVAREDDLVTRRPEPGVYRYEGSGTESLSVPPLSHDQGPIMPGTVEIGDHGCWTFRVDYNSNHWQSWEHCPAGDDPDDLVEARGQSWQRWMVGATAITNLTDFVCDDGAMLAPADPAPGQEWAARCVGTNDAVDGESVSDGTHRFVGEEDVRVGDTTVATHHFVRERTISGTQVGTERIELWYAVETGLPVRNERSVEVRTGSPVGESTYTEAGEFHLVSIRPE